VISVVLVDDHAVVRSGIRLLLERQDDIEVVGEAGNAKDALFRARALKPDVILLDVVMPGESGIDVLPRLLEESPETKVLVLSMQDDPSYVREAFAAGAQGYVLKEAADEEVVSAVREGSLCPPHARSAHGRCRGGGEGRCRRRPSFRT
jgi:two-component system response regulator NreC